MDTKDMMMLTNNMIRHVNICAEARSSSLDCDHGSWPQWPFNMNPSTTLDINMCRGFDYH